MKVMRFERSPDKVNICIIVDVYDWAWDIASRELLEHSKRLNGIIYSCADFIKQRPKMDMFDLVLFYPWGNNRVRDRLKEQCPEKVIIGVAGGEQVAPERLKAFDIHCGMFNMVGACNKDIRRIFKRAFPDKEVFVLSHGVDTDLFRPKKRKGRKFVIGWVGNHTRPLKRFGMAEDIVRQVQNAELKATTFTDKIPHDKMPEFYNAIDILLVTSDTEAHPMIVYEAMSCGKVVVTTDAGDVSETINNGVNGYVLSIHSKPEEFVKVINKLKSSKKLRQKIGDNARQTILNSWTWDKIAKDYNHLERFIWSADQLEDLFLRGSSKERIGLPAFRMRNVLLHGHEFLYGILAPTLDMYENGEDMRDTPYIRFGKKRVRNKEYFYGVKHMKDVPARQDNVLELYELFKEHGYSLQESYKYDMAHKKATSPPTCVYFTDDGRAMIYDGMHRQCIMKYLGIDTEVFCGISVAGGGDFPIEKSLKVINSGKNCYEPKHDPRLKDWHVWRKDSPRRLDTILGYIKEGSVLDVGCSEAWFSHELAKRDYDVQAIEIDPRRLAIARYLGLKQNLDITYHNIDWKKFIIESGHFNNIILLSIIHHEGLSKGNPGIEDSFSRLRNSCDRAFIEMPLKARDISWTPPEKKDAFDFGMAEIKAVMEDRSGMKLLGVWGESAWLEREKDVQDETNKKVSRNGIRPIFILGAE